jgi:TRAP-type C4-dicarboxylate transport system permease small subunit
MTDDIGLRVAVVAAFAAVIILGSWSVVDKRIRPWIVAAALALTLALSSRATTGWLHGVTVVATVASLATALVIRALGRRGSATRYSRPRARE